MHFQRLRKDNRLSDLMKVCNIRPLSYAEFLKTLTPRRRLWFDILPDDIYDYIAAMVTRGEQGQDALNLATACPELSRPIVSSLAFRCVISPSISRPTDWAGIFFPYVTELKMFRGVEPSALLICRARSLHTVHISDDPRLLRAISFNKSIRSLHIDVRNNVSIPLLLNTLSSLKLTALIVNIDVQVSLNCPFHPANPNKITPSQLHEACPLVTALFVKCSHTHTPEECPQLALMAEFPSLEIAVVDKDSPPPQAVIPLLRRIPKVNILFTKNSLQLAAALGPNIIRLRIAELLDEQQIASIIRCPHLIELALNLRASGNSALLKLCCSLKSLQSLRVTYEWEGIYALHSRMRKWWLGLPLVWTAGIYPHIARSVPNLSNLVLPKASVPFTQLEEILKMTGQRLKTLALSVFDQDIPPVDYCERLLYTVWKFNPKLRQLSLTNFRFSNRQINTLRKALDTKKWIMDAQRRRIEIFREKLAGRVPSLHICGLDIILDTVSRQSSTSEMKVE